ncbi:aminoglycoside phosphotransferase family protein [Allokutzneria sp. A3M-2-11 16]|uniref:phosphotransferase family protein n=1 Tax=Allokutzneria sp. A3M-2-11 16 TaxID=2962043 RepID=UPI0020B8F9B2|nr:phosphotransferase [Allokutzneria sp. A3M-2-11 16]MCP3800157.1 aminoglycoside phosphotransferase family protein [Allokutzneria sp. A3M-2-11 16]
MTAIPTLRKMLDMAIAEAIMRRARPAATVTEVLPRSGGQLHKVYEVRCAEPADSVIAKVYAEGLQPRQDKEVHVLRLLAEHGIAAPSVLHTERGITVLTLLPGEPLSSVSASLDEAQARRVYRQIGELTAAMHEIRTDAYGYLTTHIAEPYATNSEYMLSRFTDKLEEFLDFGGDPATHDAVRAHVAEHAERFGRCQAPVLCHNDLHDGNVLVSKGIDGWRVTGLIDVENVISADPLLDLAKAHYYAGENRDTTLGWLLEGYGPLPEDWQDRLATYALFHALELWNWFTDIEHTDPLPGIAEDIRHLART